MKINRDLVHSKFDLVQRNLGLLESIRKVEYREFVSDFLRIQAAKHALQESIEACLDVANHIIAVSGFRRPETHADMPQVLFENGIIAGNLKKRLTNMSRFRNLLVHQYGDIDNKEIYRILQEDLGDITKFMKQILEYLKKKNGN